jgi:putative PIN family toxin of toxin-antitoxin system
MKVVLDTNCLLRALSKSSRYRCLWDAFRRGSYALCYTTEMLQEYEELLWRFYPPDVVLFTMDLLLKSPNVVQVTPFYRWNLIPIDPDDNKFTDCALNARADYIVTNDKHFNVLKYLGFPLVKVVDIDTFKKIIE